MPVKQSVSVGDLVIVTFLDHAENSQKAMLFEATGRLTKKTKDEYILHFWRYVSDVDRAADDNKENENCFAIVHSAVRSIRKLK